MQSSGGFKILIWIFKLDIFRNDGESAASGAGAMAGDISISGITDKSQEQIDDWIRIWLHKYETYDFTSENCQKFAWEFTRWLTNGVFHIPHR